MWNQVCVITVCVVDDRYSLEMRAFDVFKISQGREQCASGVNKAKGMGCNEAHCKGAPGTLLGRALGVDGLASNHSAAAKRTNLPDPHSLATKPHAKPCLDSQCLSTLPYRLVFRNDIDTPP